MNVGDTVQYKGRDWSIKDKYTTDHVKGDVLLITSGLGRNAMVWEDDLTSISQVVA